MAEKTEFVSKVFDNIIKSEEDSRTYCGLVLVNGMRVLLISDPTTDKSAAALDVHIGFMSDPPDLPGLSHFCEHMLFLGTAKYPTENSFSNFLQQHCGSSNACTAEEHTCFYFDVAPKSFTKALDRFSQFFLCPLFTESATEKEVNAVDSEHKKNLQVDSWRLNQLRSATCNPKHDYSKFGTGNIETLWNIPKSKGISVRDELLKFHEKYYSSNIMALVVLGTETIEELSNIIVPLFSNVSNKEVKIPEWKDHPFDPSRLKLQGCVVPVEDIRIMSISFSIPDLHHLYKSNPGLYLSNLIEIEAPRSLLSELKRHGWVNKLVAAYKPGAKGFAFFAVNFDLTDEGLSRVNDIVAHFFQYLAMLKEKGPQEWIFEECKNLASMRFRFKDWEEPQDYVYSLASMMFDYPMEEILCGSYLLYSYRPDLINNLLDMLTPDKIRIGVVAKKYEDVCTDVEKWYGTRHKYQPIPEDVLDSWRHVTTPSICSLPLPNEFIPTSFELVEREENNPKYPQLIQNTAMGRLWFKQDDKFLLPKAVLNFELESPVAYADPLHYNMSTLFVQLVKDSLNEYGCAAERAGLSYYLDNTKTGIYLHIIGYNDKQHVLLSKIMDRLTNFKIDESRFNILKAELHRCLKNFHAEQPHHHAVYFTSLLLAERMWTNEELLNCMDEVTIEGVGRMIRSLLFKVHVEALIHGNLTRNQALSLMDIVVSALEKNTCTQSLVPSFLTRDREVQLPDGHNYVYEATNDTHSCSCVEVYYQCGIQETRSNKLLELLCQLLSEPCFNFLRTQEQLGYIVCSGPRRSNCAQGIRILIQSDKLPCYVDGRIEEFIQYFDEYIQSMSDEEFQNHSQSLSTLCLEKPKSLCMQTVKYWLEIASKQYNFDRDNIEVATLRTIKKEELYSFFKELVAYDAPNRKKLSVHVKSSSCKSVDEMLGDLRLPCTPEPSDDLPPSPELRPPEKIENVIAFKNGLGFYPLVPPFVCIPPPLHTVPEKSKL